MAQPAEHLELHVRVEAPGENAVTLLHRESGLSKGRVKDAMTRGAVWITRGSNTQRLRRAKRELKAGDEIHLYYNAEILAEEPAEPMLVADVGEYSVWNKPYGMRSQGSKWGDHCTVARWAERNLMPERPAFVVHRLDRAASGLILVAHSRKTAANLSLLFQNREVDKRYRAWVKGDFSRHESPCRVDSDIDGKHAVSEFAFVKTEGGRSLVDVRIETGRKHQVRRHLAELGFPIVGDRLYGDAANDEVDLQLVACRLAFHCPVAGEPVEYRV